MDKDKLSKITEVVKEKIARGDYERSALKWKGFSGEEKSLIKQCMEESWKRGSLKNKQLAKLMLNSLGSDMAKSEE